MILTVVDQGSNLWLGTYGTGVIVMNVTDPSAPMLLSRPTVPSVSPGNSPFFQLNSFLGRQFLRALHHYSRPKIEILRDVNLQIQ